MKKTLIAIAALVATGAFAQSTATLSGSLDAGFVSSTNRGVSGSGIVGNLTSTSGFGLNVASDLGGGMTAYGKIWSDVNPGATYGGSSGTNTLNLANSENKIGLRGGFGDIAFGAINDIGLESHLTMTSFGTAIGSGTSATSQMNASAKARSDNTIAYNSPKFSGLSVGYVGRKQQVNGSNVIGLGATSNAAQSAVSQIALRYNAGPLNAIISRVTDDGLNVQTAAATAATFSMDAATGLWNVPVGAAAAKMGTKVVINNIAGNYNMGALTVYAGMQGVKGSSATAASTDRSGLTFGGKYVMGANTFMATMGRTSENLTGAALNGKSTKNVGLGYEYALSKTTSLVARYDRLTDDLKLTNASAAATASIGGTATAGDETRSRMAIGVRTAF